MPRTPALGIWGKWTAVQCKSAWAMGCDSVSKIKSMNSLKKKKRIPKTPKKKKIRGHNCRSQAENESKSKGDLLPASILGDSVSGTPSPFPPSRATHPGTWMLSSNLSFCFVVLPWESGLPTPSQALCHGELSREERLGRGERPHFLPVCLVVLYLPGPPQAFFSTLAIIASTSGTVMYSKPAEWPP